MIVVLKPAGRGNWQPMTIRYDGQQVLPLFVTPGARLEFGGVTWRVHQVLESTEQPVKEKR